MTTTPTTPTSGAADLPEALRRSTAADGKTELFNLPGYPLMVRAVDFNRIHTESEMRRTALLDEMQKAALAAGQATAAPAQPAAQQGAAYAALPEYGINTASHAHFRVLGFTADQMRDFADATHALRASHGEAPAGATEPTEQQILEAAFAPAQPAAQQPQGVAYAELPDEREMLKHALWLASSFTVHRYLMSNAEGRWSGAEKATCHDELCRLYVAVFRGVEVDQVRVDLEADWMAVHDATQELTDHMDVVIGFPLKGVPDYDALAPKFFDHFHRLATHTLRASHGQAPAGAGEPTEQQILEAAFAPAQPAVEASRFGSPELQAMIIARCVEKDQADSVQEDAARYRLLRRGQHWSVIDGIGNDLRAEALDADVDAARKQGANHD